MEVLAVGLCERSFMRKGFSIPLLPISWSALYRHLFCCLCFLAESEERRDALRDEGAGTEAKRRVSFIFYSVANNSVLNGVDCFFPSLRRVASCFSLALLSEVQGVKSINERTDPTW